ncbi:MAG: hypothetical protein KF687_01425 [Cyclobacteriaceae bacterium]|nr:hypothetical protein [Cyclobacteriaceae bacterium]
MKIHFASALLGCLLALTATAQETSARYTDFPIIVTVQFHAFSLPFKNLKANVRNVGIGIGTEVSHNKKHTWVTQVGILWYHNKHIGNGIMPHVQTGWRPSLSDDVYTELKAGAGYLLSSRPAQSWKLVNGKWESVGHRGRSMLALPVGVSVGYNTVTNNSILSPFVTYQFMLVTGYNTSLPVVPETILQTGIRAHQKP